MNNTISVTDIATEIAACDAEHDRRDQANPKTPADADALEYLETRMAALEDALLLTDATTIAEAACLALGADSELRTAWRDDFPSEREMRETLYRAAHAVTSIANILRREAGDGVPAQFVRRHTVRADDGAAPAT